MGAQPVRAADGSTDRPLHASTSWRSPIRSNARTCQRSPPSPRRRTPGLPQAQTQVVEPSVPMV